MISGEQKNKTEKSNETILMDRKKRTKNLSWRSPGTGFWSSFSEIGQVSEKKNQIDIMLFSLFLQCNMKSQRANSILKHLICTTLP